MIRQKFPLTSDQMELLLAFEKAGSLESLSDAMAKDPSVISRRLTNLAACLPVLLKVGRRWQITSLGRQINAMNRSYIEDLERMVKVSVSTKRKSIVPDGSALILINVQKALHMPGQGQRSNWQAEENILSLLKYWRKRKWPIVFVKHISENPGSLFFRQAPGAEFILGFEIQNSEVVIEKTKASAFMKTNLEKVLQQFKSESIVLVGFTAGECIDATARQASDMEIPTFVIGDATASFDVVGPNGKLHKADKIHKATLANLHANFADVIDTVSVTT